MRFHAESFILCFKKTRPDIHQQIAQLCIHPGFELKITHEGSSKEVQLRLVESGMDISLIAASSQTRHNAKVVCRLIVDSIPTLQISAVWQKKQQSVGLSNLIDN